MVSPIGDLGLTPNRVAALGLNLVLLVNLAGAAWLSARVLQGSCTFHRLERWQTAYLPVFPLWAATGVGVLPPAFASAWACSAQRESLARGVGLRRGSVEPDAAVGAIGVVGHELLHGERRAVHQAVGDPEMERAHGRAVGAGGRRERAGVED